MRINGNTTLVGAPTDRGGTASGRPAAPEWAASTSQGTGHDDGDDDVEVGRINGHDYNYPAGPH